MKYQIINKLTWPSFCECAGIDFGVVRDVGVVDLNDTPENLALGPGSLLLVNNPVPVGSVLDG